MTLQSIGQLVALPAWFPYQTTTGQLNDANEMMCGIWRPTFDDTITALGFRCTAAATPKTIRIGMQSVDASTGLASGTWLGATNNGYADQAAPVANTTYLLTLGEGVPVAAGSAYAIVAKLADDGDLPADVSVQCISSVLWFPSGLHVGPVNSAYVVAPTTKWGSGAPAFLISASGVYRDCYLSPVIDTAAAAVSLDADGAIRAAGNRFRLPFGARAVGLVSFSDTDQDAECHLWADDGTPLASATHDKDLRSGTGAATGFIPFSDPFTLVADTWYRGLIKATATTAATLLYKLTLGDAAYMGQLPLGANCHYFSYDGTTFTDETAQRASCAIVIDQIDIGGGGGRGGVIGAGMNGGILG